MKSHLCLQTHLRRITAAGRSAFLSACLVLMGAAGSEAQDDRPPLPIDPTPLIELVTAQERASLSGAQKPSKQVEIYLEISDRHLELAYAAIKGGDSSRAERELDIYNKATAEAIKVAFSQRDGKRSLSKKIEQRLYKQIKTLELVERLFPENRLPFVEAALKQAKQLRVQALNEAFASGDVLEDPTKEKKPNEGSAGKDGAAENPELLLPIAYFAGNPRMPSQIPGDYLNEEEDEHVRQAQDPDERIKVFMKIADRRLTALTGPPTPPADKKAQKQAEEEERKWGALPKVSRAELLRHYARAIEEAMAKLEDAYERNPKSSALPRALTILRDATDRHLQTLRSLEAGLKDETEMNALREAIGEAETANQGARQGLKPKTNGQ